MKALQGFRFLLMIPIFFVHCGFVENMTDGGWWHSEYFNSTLSVTFFFLLSGFVLAIGYKDKFSILSAHEYKAFVKRRYVKLAPVYVITMFIVFIWWLLTGPELYGGTGKTILKFVFSLTMLQTLTVKYWSLFNMVCWFASAIFVCYLFAPFLIHFLQKRDTTKVVFSIIFSYFMIILLMFGTGVLVRIGALDTETRRLIIYATPYTRIFYFVIGLSTGMLCANRGEGKRPGTMQEVVALVLYAIGYVYGVVAEDNLENDLFYIIICIFILYSFYHDGGFISRVLGNKILLYMGGMSMYFFMIHFIVINYGGSWLWRKFFKNSQSFLCVIVLLAVSLLLSICSYEIGKWIKRKRWYPGGLR